MSIQSTVDITREAAIYRITKIAELIKDRNFLEIEQNSLEHDCDIREFVNKYQNEDFSNLEKWTDRMLEDIMDKPYFRHSIFDNYLVIGSENWKFVYS